MNPYNKYKEMVLYYSQLLAKEGYFGAVWGSGGNVSVLIDGEEAIAITPSGKEYLGLAADDICIVNFDRVQLDGRFPPSIETGMHIAVYRHRPDINAVVHTHQPYASIFSLIEQPIPPLFDEVVINIGSRVDLIAYAPSGSRELELNVTEKLANGCNCYIMQNHGALILGQNLEEACKNAGLLEKCAQVYYFALSSSSKISTLPEKVVLDMMEQLKQKQQQEIERKKHKQNHMRS